MTQPIDVAKATSLIAQAEQLQTQLQLFVDALRAAAGATTGSAGDIGHPPAGGDATN